MLSLLTLGFGDFYPTKVATQIVLFPFLLVGIAQLANLIRMIVSFFSKRAETRSITRRARHEKKKQLLQDYSSQKPDLETEVRFLRQLNLSEEWYEVLEDLTIGLCGFVVFWVIGALMFSRIEVIILTIF